MRKLWRFKEAVANNPTSIRPSEAQDTSPWLISLSWSGGQNVDPKFCKKRTMQWRWLPQTGFFENERSSRRKPLGERLSFNRHETTNERHGLHQDIRHHWRVKPSDYPSTMRWLLLKAVSCEEIYGGETSINSFTIKVSNAASDLRVSCAWSEDRSKLLRSMVRPSLSWCTVA